MFISYILLLIREDARMPVFQAKRHVNHSANEMFDLVADVERYPAFVPLCERHVIRSRKKYAEIEILMTEMTVAYKIFRESILSRVTLDRVNGRIVVEAVDGPLRELETHWTFQARDDGSCDVGFSLSYELASRTLALLMGAVFDAAFSRFVEAFQRRADVIYGRRLVAGVRREKAQRPAPAQPHSCSRYAMYSTTSSHSAMHHRKHVAS